MAFTGTSAVTESVSPSNDTFSSPESKTVTFSSGSQLAAASNVRNCCATVKSLLNPALDAATKPFTMPAGPSSGRGPGAIGITGSDEETTPAPSLTGPELGIVVHAVRATKI